MTMDDLTMQEILNYAYCYTQIVKDLFTPQDKMYMKWQNVSTQLTELCHDEELGKYTLTDIKSKL